MQSLKKPDEWRQWVRVQREVLEQQVEFSKSALQKSTSTMAWMETVSRDYLRELVRGAATQFRKSESSLLDKKNSALMRLEILQRIETIMDEVTDHEVTRLKSSFWRASIHDLDDIVTGVEDVVRDRRLTSVEDRKEAGKTRERKSTVMNDKSSEIDEGEYSVRRVTVSGESVLEILRNGKPFGEDVRGVRKRFRVNLNQAKMVYAGSGVISEFTRSEGREPIMRSPRRLNNRVVGVRCRVMRSDGFSVGTRWVAKPYLEFKDQEEVRLGLEKARAIEAVTKEINDFVLGHWYAEVKAKKASSGRRRQATRVSKRTGKAPTRVKLRITSNRLRKG